jgi:hypothetical protein
MSEATKGPSWLLADGRTVQYYNINGHEFSNLPEEDFDYAHAKEMSAAWAQWSEFIKNNPDVSAGENPNPEGEPVAADRSNQTVMSIRHIPTPEMPARTREFAAGYEAGFNDAATKNAPPF